MQKNWNDNPSVLHLKLHKLRQHETAVNESGFQASQAQPDLCEVGIKCPEEKKKIVCK